MDFILSRGRDFSEHFDFKSENGKPVALPQGEFKIVLERGTFAREYKIGSGLTRLRNQIRWNIDADQSKDFAYNVMYYTMYLNNQELARGILRMQ